MDSPFHTVLCPVCGRTVRPDNLKSNDCSDSGFTECYICDCGCRFSVTCLMEPYD